MFFDSSRFKICSLSKLDKKLETQVVSKSSILDKGNSGYELPLIETISKII